MPCKAAAFSDCQHGNNLSLNFTEYTWVVVLQGLTGANLLARGPLKPGGVHMPVIPVA